jgi:hypothetical protein
MASEAAAAADAGGADAAGAEVGAACGPSSCCGPALDGRAGPTEAPDTWRPASRDGGGRPALPVPVVWADAAWMVYTAAPAVGRSRPSSVETNDDLPAPLPPMMAVTRPGRISPLTPASRDTPAVVRLRFSNAMCTPSCRGPPCTPPGSPLTAGHAAVVAGPATAGGTGAGAAFPGPNDTVVTVEACAAAMER